MARACQRGIVRPVFQRLLLPLSALLAIAAADIALAQHAENAAQAATRWGLPGTWKPDCRQPASRANPAFTFSAELTGAYFGKLAIVAAPPAARHRLASVVLDYTWGGLGDAVHWTLTAKDLGGSPSLAVTGPQGKPGAGPKRARRPRGPLKRPG